MNGKIWFWFLFTVLLFASQLATAQVDTLTFKSGEFIIGEIKSMHQGVLVAETNYSDSDFKIEWKEVTGVYLRSQFLVTLSNGRKW